MSGAGPTRRLRRLALQPAADRTDTVSVGASGSERQIVNVPAGIQACDAVNVSNCRATRVYEALIRTRLAQGDRSGALEDYARFERIRQTTLDTPASAAIRGLVAPLLDPSPR